MFYLLSDLILCIIKGPFRPWIVVSMKLAQFYSNLETLGTNKLNTDNHISKVVLNANNNGVTFTIDGVPYTSPIMVAGKSITRMEIDTTLSKLTLSFFYDGQIIKRYVSLSAS